MEILPLKTPPDLNWSVVPEIIESCCAELGLTQSLRGSLAKYPGAIHWHYKLPGQTGTLEITASEKRQEIWISVQSGRRADWIPAKAEHLIEMIETWLAK